MRDRTDTRAVLMLSAAFEDRAKDGVVLLHKRARSKGPRAKGQEQSLAPLQSIGRSLRHWCSKHTLLARGLRARGQGARLQFGRRSLRVRQTNPARPIAWQHPWS